MTSEQIALNRYWKALDSIWKVVHTPTKHTNHRTAADHYQADFDAIRKIVGSALSSQEQP